MLTLTLTWISNKTRKISDFSKLQYTPKFADNQRITDTDLHIFVCIFVHIRTYSFHMFYTKFGAYLNHMYTKTNWPTDRQSQYNLKLNLCHCTASYREGDPHQQTGNCLKKI
jgi:hypothetical protein